jgi:hypothetical protein
VVVKRHLNEGKLLMVIVVVVVNSHFFLFFDSLLTRCQQEFVRGLDLSQLDGLEVNNYFVLLFVDAVFDLEFF